MQVHSESSTSSLHPYKDPAFQLVYLFGSSDRLDILLIERDPLAQKEYARAAHDITSNNHPGSDVLERYLDLGNTGS